MSSIVDILPLRQKALPMNFHQLKYILSVDAHRNFARAAEECEIAQSTLSKEIQRLEKEFGILIFDRSRHPVVPTLNGIDLLKQAKLVIAEKDGQYVYYSLNTTVVDEIMKWFLQFKSKKR